MNRISLNVIVYNEEARLEECLLDARDHVDEIVVVDQMSTDGTPQIAQRLADVYIRDVHHGHAEPSRELAASRSSGDWLLILDADEKMSDLLKAEIRELVERDTDGYWIRKLNSIDGDETSTVKHFRLVRKSRARFDPRPHGGATTVSENVEHFEQIGIIHEKTVAEQLYDDARYEQLSVEDDAPSSSKRNWLSHNRTLRAHREQAHRSDLQALLPPDARSALVLGDVPIELSGCAVVRAEDPDRLPAFGEGPGFDAAVVALGDAAPSAVLRAVADHVRPGGVVVGTSAASRNIRRVEELVGALLSDSGVSTAASVRATTGGTTRTELLGELRSAGFDPRWMRLVRDGWLDPVALQPSGRGAIVESEDFLLKDVPADVAEELTADEIVFVAVRSRQVEAPPCSIVMAALTGTDAPGFADALRSTEPQSGYELVIVHSSATEPAVEGGRWVTIGEDAGLAARWNAGARAATSELLVFVSGDAMPLPGWLDGLVAGYRSRADVGAVGSKVVARDGTIEHAGLVLGPDGIPYRIYQGEAATAPSVNRTRIMPAVVGDGMIIRRARFVEVGGFDEALGDDLADADLCLRLRARGLPIVFSAASVLRSTLRSLPESRGRFRHSVREFTTRWSRAIRSDELICRSDGHDASWQWNRSWRLPRASAPPTNRLPAVAWSSHFYERGGYTEEAVAAVEALDDAGLHVVANPVTYDRQSAPVPARKAERLAALMNRDLPDDFVHISHIGANRFKRHPSAMRNVGRTMFETDGLPVDWRDQCNAMDEVWVPCEHNLRSFAKAGVAPSKLYLVPETFDAELFDPGVEPLAIDGLGGFVFLSVFSWLGRKAWDVLLRAWYEEFGKQDDVTLLLKTDSDLAPPGTDCRHEVDLFVRGQLGHNPRKGPPVVVLDRLVELTDVPRLYQAADAFVLASHGEGWGRPYMEAMAMGLPTIATRWSGNLEFMNDDNSYLVDYDLVDTPADTWLAGQRWAQPSVRDLRRALRRVYEHRREAKAIGARARSDVLVSCGPERVVSAVRERLEDVDRHPVHVSLPGLAPIGAADAPRKHARRTKDGRRLSACIVDRTGSGSLRECLSSLAHVADAITVVEEIGGDLAALRNEALDKASGGWVLMLDSSQTLDPASVEVVRELVDRGGFAGYTARERRQFGLDGAVSAVDQRTAVLFPRHPDLRYVGPVAEQLLPQRPDTGFRLVRSTIILHRHDRSPESWDPVARARRFLPVLERAAREAPQEPFHLYNLGDALEHLGLHAEAEGALRNAVETAPRHATWVPAACLSLSRAVGAQGRRAEAVKLCKRVTRLDPEWAYAWCMLGAALVDAGRPNKALRVYTRALDCAGDAWSTAGQPDDTAWQARAAMGKIHLEREEYHEANECLTEAVALRPTSAELRVWLARACEAVGRAKEARRHLEVAMSARPGPEAYIRFSDHFTNMAENALLRGLADNPESRVLLQGLERLRAGRELN